MKKLMLAVAMVCAAAMVQASTVSWQYATKLNDGSGKSTSYCTANSPAYLVFVSDLSRAEALAGLNAAGSAKSYQATLAGSAISSTAMVSSKIGATTASGVTVGSTEKAYFVVFDGDKMFVSAEVSKTMYDELSDTYTWTFATANTKNGGKASYEAEAGLASANAGAGWYTASIPEPTSGLLLLLGMAGLALRRRRA